MQVKEVFEHEEMVWTNWDDCPHAYCVCLSADSKI